MAIHGVLKDCKIYLAGYNLSSDTNELRVEAGAEMLENTVWGNTTRTFQAGLLTGRFSGAGLFQADANDFQIDDVLSDKFGDAGEVVTISPVSGAAGERAAFMKSVLSKYAHGGKVGELHALEFEINASGDIVMGGSILATGAKTSTANGTAYNLGAVTASQKLFAAMHVTAVSGTGPTLDMIIESDDAEAFTDPTTRITFSQKNAIGAEWATPVAGAIADTWWRASWTIAGVDPSFTVVVVMGIR